MALKFNWKKNLSKIIWGVIILILTICIIRVAVWEASYYAGMEGTTRATAIDNTIAPEDTNENVDETERTEADKLAWRVSPEKPRFLSIDKLGIDRARVTEVGLNNIGRLQTPNNIFDVGWYRSSGKPGEGRTLLIDGHNGGPNLEGVFKHLPNLVPGDIIEIERGDGKFFRYKVVENEEVPLSEADSKMSKMLTTPENGKESLSIITCTGAWSQVQNTYLSRQFLRAVLEEDNTNYTPTKIENELQKQREEKAKKAAEESNNTESKSE